MLLTSITALREAYSANQLPRSCHAGVPQSRVVTQKG